MLGTILQFEIKQLLRNKGIIVALVIYTGIGYFALQQGKSIYDFQQISIQKVLKNVKRDDSTVRAIFDTLNTTTALRSDANVEAPWSLEWRLGAAEAKSISPLSILSIGQNDIYNPVISTHFGRQFFKNEFAEFQNPEKLLIGNLDVSYFILFLFPLLLLALTYNIQSADKEAGILPLLKVQATSIKKILYYRLLLRWLVALLPYVVVSLLCYVTIYSKHSFLLSAFLQWWAVALLYALFWLVLVAYILSLQLSSLLNAIVLAGLWVVLLIAIPGLFNTLFSYTYPATDKGAITSFRDIDAKGYNKPLKVHLDNIISLYPNWKNVQLTSDSNYIKSFGNTLEGIEAEKKIHHIITTNSKQQTAAEEKSFWINPIGGVMRSFATLSNSTLANQQAFETATIVVRERKGKYLHENYIIKPHFTKTDYEAMPKYKEIVEKRTVYTYMLPLLVMIVILVVVLLIKNKPIK